MTIRNKDVYMGNLWDWGFLDDCFGGTRIRVTDLDGVVERKGHFLYLEAKSPGKDVPKGQQIMFNHLIAEKNKAVLVIWGKPNVPEMAQFWGCKPFVADSAKIQEVVANVTLSQIETGKFLPTPELDRAIRDGLCWTEREDTALEMLNGERVPA